MNYNPPKRAVLEDPSINALKKVIWKYDARVVIIWGLHIPLKLILGLLGAGHCLRLSIC